MCDVSGEMCDVGFVGAGPVSALKIIEEIIANGCRGRRPRRPEGIEELTKYTTFLRVAQECDPYTILKSNSLYKFQVA